MMYKRTIKLNDMWVKEKAHRHQRANVVMACREVSKLTEIQSLTRDREIFILFIFYFFNTR